MRRRSMVLAAVIGLTAVLAGLIGNIATNNVNIPRGWMPAIWTATALLSLLAITGGLLDHRRSGPVGDKERKADLSSITDQLAHLVRQQWGPEAMRRGLYDRLIAVQWRPADESYFMAWPALAELATNGLGWPPPTRTSWAADPTGLAGSGNELLRTLERVPTGRLVVLGQPGSGKTVLLIRLVMDLLAHRESGDPIPILLSLSSWNPVAQDFDAWIERSLITNYPELAHPLSSNGHVSAARDIYSAGLVTLLLDGLDELPDTLRSHAIGRLNRAMRPGQQLVLTARPDEYRRTVSPPAGPEVLLAGAAGVEVCPLSPSDVIDHLVTHASGPVTRARWGEILKAVSAEPSMPIAQALTTPLMIFLARTIYEPRPDEQLVNVQSEPRELLDRSRFPNRDAVEQHLLEHFISAVYRRHLTPGNPTNVDRWTADQGRRWLAFLAKQRDEHQRITKEVAWWNLHRSAPRRLGAAVVGIVSAVLAAIAFPFVGAGLGYAAAFSTGLTVRRWIRLPGNGLALAIAGGVLGGLSGGLLGLVVFGPGEANAHLSSFIGNGLTVGVVVGALGRFVAAFAAGLVGQTVTVFYEQAPSLESIRASTAGLTHLFNGVGVGMAAAVAVALLGKRVPARRLRWSWSGFGCGLLIGVFTGISVWAQSGIRAGLVAGLAAGVGVAYGGAILLESTAVDLSTAPSPLSVLRRDRATFWKSFIGFGVAFGGTIGAATALSVNAVTGVPMGARVGSAIGIADFIIAGLVFAFIQASWGSYVLARCWLALSRRLPWRLAAFLVDAHVNRGLLRQAGAVYEFRHESLQRRLIGVRTSPSGLAL